MQRPGLGHPGPGQGPPAQGFGQPYGSAPPFGMPMYPGAPMPMPYGGVPFMPMAPVHQGHSHGLSGGVSMGPPAQLHPGFVPGTGAAPGPGGAKSTNLFVGSISGGITDEFMTQLLTICGPLSGPDGFKRLITPAGKPQGFGFAAFAAPTSALRALSLLGGPPTITLPALEDGCASKVLLVKADEKTKIFLDAFKSSLPPPSEAQKQQDIDDRKRIDDLVKSLTGNNGGDGDGSGDGEGDKEKFIIPPHLHDLQEADLPETQRGLVISEIAMFRERAAKREREKLRDVREAVGRAMPGSSGSASTYPTNAPKGPSQGAYNKPVGFVPAGTSPSSSTPSAKEPSSTKSSDPATDDLNAYNAAQQQKARSEHASFMNHLSRYEPRERTRLVALQRTIARIKGGEEAQSRDKKEMSSRLAVWDDDESDETFYVDRARWRAGRSARLRAEQEADERDRQAEIDERRALERESESFLDGLSGALGQDREEQTKMGMLVDDGAPVRLSVSINPLKPSDAPSNSTPSASTPAHKAAPKAPVKPLFTEEEDSFDPSQRKRAPLVKLDFSVAESSEAQVKERLEGLKERAKTMEQEELFKGKVRWDGLNDTLIDRKLEPIVKRLIIKALGEEMEEEAEDLIMFVLEHLKDHKPPAKLVEGLEPVLDTEAEEVVKGLWRQVIFESLAYGEGLHSERMLVE